MQKLSTFFIAGIILTVIFLGFSFLEKKSKGAAVWVWSDPKNLGSQINSAAKDEHATFTPDGQTMVFASTREGGFGAYDLYVSHLENGEWTKAELLPLPINTQKDDFDPFITPDGNMLYLNSNRGGPDKKDVDIWRFDFKEGRWTSPRLMGGPFLSDRHDYDPCLSPDGKRFYFTSDRDGGLGDADIYVVEKIRRKSKDRMTALKFIVGEPSNSLLKRSLRNEIV